MLKAADRERSNAEIGFRFSAIQIRKAFQQALPGIVTRKPHTAMTLKGLSDIGAPHPRLFVFGLVRVY